MKNIFTAIIVIIFSYIFFYTNSVQIYAQTLNFTRQQVNDKGTQGHALGDMNGDGKLDVIMAEGEFDGNKIFSWAKYPDWSLTTIDSISAIEYVSDAHTADIDRDGDTDIIIGNAHNSSANSILIYLNNNNGATFSKLIIGSDNNRFIKDFVVRDLNKDGRLDLALRYGGTGVNKAVFLYQPNTITSAWEKIETNLNLSDTQSEGMEMTDVNNDGKEDYIYNGKWLKNPGTISSWGSPLSFDSSAPADARIAVGDLDGDGLNDVVMGHSEGGGAVYWYKYVTDTQWTKSIIVPNGVIDFAHTMQVADMDNDGDKDVITASLESNGIYVYRNNGNGTSWTQSIISSTHSSYIGKVGDINGDGKIDFMTSNSYHSGPMSIWINDTSLPTLSLDKWSYFTIDSNRPIVSPYIFGMTFADVSGDGFLDVLTGKSFYKNPGGNMTGNWLRTDVAESTDFKLNLNIDNDAYPDIIGYGPDNQIRWYESSTGGSTFTNTVVGSLGSNSHGSGQGYVVADIVSGGKPEIILNGEQVSGDYHRIHLLQIPTNPASTWNKTTITSEATEDGLAVADLTGDGLPEVISALGDGKTITSWKNNSWTKTTIGTTDNTWADVTRVADFDNDGDQDVMVAVESYGYIFLYKNNGSGTSWTRSQVFSANNTASLDIGDFDRDGDIDAVTAEHGGDRIFLLENNNNANTWVPHQIGSWSGKDHHLGSRAVDLDQDGDLDIVSMGLNHQVVGLWRNDAINSNSQPAPTITPNPLPTLTQDPNITPSPTPKPGTPFAFYPFSEGTGGTSANLVNNTYNATLSNTSWVNGKFGKALSFNGSNSNANLGNINPQSQALTVAAWINPATLNSNTDYRIISKASGSNENDHIFMLSTLSDNNHVLRARLSTNNTTTTIIGNTSISPNQWTHVAMVYNGSTMTLYVNGVADGSTSKTGLITNSTANVLVGANPGNNSVFNGIIDDVAIYTEALTNPEIIKLMSNSWQPNISPTKTGDTNMDNVVNIFDYNMVIQYFGQSYTGGADLNHDGIVNIFDYNIVIQYFGT